MSTDNPNILFTLTNAKYGLYVFEQNPDSYDLLAPKTLVRPLILLTGENIYQRGLLDNEVRKMGWTETTRTLYDSLSRYAERDVFGNIPVSTFSDGTVMEFQGATVQILDVYGIPLKGKIDKWKVEMQIKPCTNFSNEKLVVG